MKITVPPAFGLIPAVISTPCANDLFGDDVRLNAVVEWADGRLSFAISQPQYHGEPASLREIETYSTAAGWTRIPDDNGHLIFFPFDVILCHPTEELEQFLKLY